MVLTAATQLALAKILLHAAKHPACTVNGILLGRVDNDSITVNDVIPLFHTTCNLAAPLEIALAQVDALAQQAGPSRQLVGYYHSEARMVSGDLTPVGRKVADKLSLKQPASIAVVLDNKKLATFMAGEDTPPFDLFTKDGTKGWKREAAGAVRVQGASWQQLQAEVSSLLKQRMHTTLVDFDDHLDDLSKDYCNPALEKLGKLALPGQQA